RLSRPLPRDRCSSAVRSAAQGRERSISLNRAPQARSRSSSPPHQSRKSILRGIEEFGFPSGTQGAMEGEGIESIDCELDVEGGGPIEPTAVGVCRGYAFHRRIQDPAV